MRRELLEEIGVTPQHWQSAGKFVSENPPGVFATFHVYHVDRWQGSPRLVGDEHTALRWFAAAEIDCETELAPPQLGEILAKLVGAETAETVRIQYGGSMKPSNAAELLAKKDIDGGLIGGAALKAEDFAGIIAAAN
jgi:hypothetical protein